MLITSPQTSYSIQPRPHAVYDVYCICYTPLKETSYNELVLLYRCRCNLTFLNKERQRVYSVTRTVPPNPCHFFRFRRFRGAITVPQISPGGHTLTKLYSHVPSHRVGFLRRFGLRVFTLPILVWNRVWFLRELRECMNVFIVSIPNE